MTRLAGGRQPLRLLQRPPRPPSSPSHPLVAPTSPLSVMKSAALLAITAATTVSAAVHKYVPARHAPSPLARALTTSPVSPARPQVPAEQGRPRDAFRSAARSPVGLPRPEVRRLGPVGSGPPRPRRRIGRHRQEAPFGRRPASLLDPGRRHAQGAARGHPGRSRRAPLESVPSLTSV